MVDIRFSDVQLDASQIPCYKVRYLAKDSSAYHFAEQLLLSSLACSFFVGFAETSLADFICDWP